MKHLRAWHRDKDLASINAWLDERGLSPVPANELPEIGWIVPGVGFAGLRRVEGNYYLLDGIITNPDAPASMRHQALNDFFSMAIMAAGGRPVLGFTADESIFNRALKAGFTASHFRLMKHDGDGK